MSERFTHAVDRNAIEDLLEEATDHHPHSFIPSEATTLSVEQQLFVHPATC